MSATQKGRSLVVTILLISFNLNATHTRDRNKIASGVDDEIAFDAAPECVDTKYATSKNGGGTPAVLCLDQIPPRIGSNQLVELTASRMGIGRYCCLWATGNSAFAFHSQRSPRERKRNHPPHSSTKNSEHLHHTPTPATAPVAAGSARPSPNSSAPPVWPPQ